LLPAYNVNRATVAARCGDLDEKGDRLKKMKRKEVVASCMNWSQPRNGPGDGRK